MQDHSAAAAAFRQLLHPTNKHFEDHALLWTISRAKHQVCRINSHACSTSPVIGWDVRNLGGVMQWDDRTFSSFVDAAFAFEQDDEQQQPQKSFPFMLAMAYPHSAMLKSMVSVSSGIGAQRDRIFFIPGEITRDPRVLECMVFFFYTGLLVDVHTLTKQGALTIHSVLTHDAVINTEFSFDLLELYRLAAYLRMHQLTKRIREHCLYGTSPSVPYSHVEKMLSCIIIRCARQSVGGEEELLPAAITAYVRMNKGLPCLCRWPLMYDKQVWDSLMQAAADVCHHWLPHVMPLYALLFPQAAGGITDFILKVKSLPLVQAAEKPMGSWLQDSDLRGCVSSKELGILNIVPGTCVPHVRSLQSAYKRRYGIDLAAALRKYAEPDEENRVGQWILPWTHMLAACVQLQCAIKEKKIQACVPAWVGSCIVTIMDRYSPFADEVDLEVFEKMCMDRQWLVDRIIMQGGKEPAAAAAAAGADDDGGGDAAAAAAIQSGGDMVQISVAEKICKLRRSLGILKVGSAAGVLGRMPLDYAPQIMDAVADGISMAVRLRSAGAVVRVLTCAGGARKRARAGADDGGGGLPLQQRPNYANAIDFGSLEDDDAGSSGSDQLPDSDMDD